MANKIITAVIDLEGASAGDVEIKLDGYKGKGCHAVQEVFQKGLGGKSKKLTRRPEFNLIDPLDKCITR